MSFHSKDDSLIASKGDDVKRCSCETNGGTKIGPAVDASSGACPSLVTETSVWRRVGEALSWLFPSLVLALMPKCPACVAAYIAIGTGIGLSLSTAATLQRALILMSATALGFLTVRFVVRRWLQAGV